MRRRPGLPQWVDDRLRHLVYSSVAPPQPPAAGSRRTGGCRRSHLPGYCGGDLNSNPPIGLSGPGGFIDVDFFVCPFVGPAGVAVPLFVFGLFSPSLLAPAVLLV